MGCRSRALKEKRHVRCHGRAGIRVGPQNADGGLDEGVHRLEVEAPISLPCHPQGYQMTMHHVPHYMPGQQ